VSVLSVLSVTGLFSGDLNILKFCYLYSTDMNIVLLHPFLKI
jgi:hypothetical protein